jgi:hypothetical protein
MGDSQPVVQREEVPRLVFDTLADEYGESQQKRWKGYLATQSLSELMNHLDPDDVISMRATSHVTAKDETVKGAIPDSNLAAACFNINEKLVTNIRFNFSRSDVGTFPWEGIKQFLDDPLCPVSDLAVRELTFKISDDELRDHLRKVMSIGINLHDTKYLQNPFFVEMSSRKAEAKERDQVRTQNDKAFLERVGYRVLKIDSMHSYRAHQGKSDPVMGVTPEELEELAFNYNTKHERKCGLLYSKLAINKLRKAFSRSAMDTKMQTWTEQEIWEGGAAEIQS